MGGSSGPLTGPDFAHGIALSELKEGTPLLGQAEGEAVVLVRSGEEVFAVGASCTHYGAPLAEGIVVDGTLRCPWHGARFDLKTGSAVGPPALSPVACFQVEREGPTVRVRGKREAARPAKPAVAPSSVVVVGAGAAGAACAELLRREGYEGPITLVGAEEPGPVDRPNLSKDYLAGTAQEEWIPLRTADFYRELNIELVVNDPVATLDTAAGTVRLTSGRTLAYGALLLATGSEPVKLSIEGAGLKHVHTLRTLADSRAIIAQAGTAKRAVVIGSNFIGLEAAASLRQRGLEVTVVGRDTAPLARVLGDELGRFLRQVHESKGVTFRLGVTPTRIDERQVTLSDGSTLPAELVVVGVGVKPRTALAEAAGLRVDNGILVDEHLRTSAPRVWAAGDVVRYPFNGRQVRIEHWVVAQNQGQAAARAMLGQDKTFRSVPFFWSNHYDVPLGYIGHVERWDRMVVYGSLEARDACVAYWEGGRIRAVATLGRDRTRLLAEAAMERGDDRALEQIVSSA
ncbi:MAG TPA: FAD-dependent oxidoreductase [Myxococcaceae bacterium]|jgi:NADPH-dependent 2,4-dienoyl-CoA reductase/sulfur reductase-like enzyme